MAGEARAARETGATSAARGVMSLEAAWRSCMVRAMSRSTFVFLAAASLAAAACGGSSSTGGAPPPQPPNGAPLAFQVVKLHPGADRDGKLDVKAYNFSDRELAGYTVAVHYTDDQGKLIKVGVGTPFEKDTAWTSMSGQGFQCKPKAWCSFDIEMIEVPASTKKAEVALTGATALKADGFTFEDGRYWESPKGMGEWPF
jgi:hypothetical protein